MLKKLSQKLTFCLLVTLFCCGIASTSLAADIDKSTSFTPEEVISVLETDTTNINSNNLLNKMLLPGSMNITVPNIDMDKVIITTPLKEFSSDLKNELLNHGYSEQKIMSLNFSDYRNAEKDWKLSDEQIQIAVSLYPELKQENISNWTNADFEKYYTTVDKANMVKRFSNEQILTLQKKGIQTDDLFYLFKEFYTVDTIMAQSDDTLKNTIQQYYQFKLDNVKALSVNNTASSTKSAVRSVDQTKYTQQNMPRYGTDWFLNSVVTSDAWRQVQSDRTLKAMQVLYNNNLSTFNSSNVTNMYGTYSASQGGAHEGIDFAYGSNGTAIYAIFDGQVITPKSSHSTHQLCVYDANAGKSYNYLHMNSKSVSVGDQITHGNGVGQQGKKGNASGPHVHFEVHSGQTNTLSSESDNSLGSISPYQLQIYLGEL